MNGEILEIEILSPDDEDIERNNKRKGRFREKRLAHRKNRKKYDLH